MDQLRKATVSCRDGESLVWPLLAQPISFSISVYALRCKYNLLYYVGCKQTLNYSVNYTVEYWGLSG